MILKEELWFLLQLLFFMPLCMDQEQPITAFIFDTKNTIRNLGSRNLRSKTAAPGRNGTALSARTANGRSPRRNQTQ